MSMFPATVSVRNGQLAVFYFDTNSTSAPDGLVDPGGLAATSSPLARAAAGDLSLTLKHRYTRIYAVAQIYDSTNGVSGGVYTVTQGSAAANVIKIKTETEDAGGVKAKADTTDKRIVVIAVLEP